MSNHFLSLLQRALVQRAESFPGVAGFSVLDLVSGEQNGFLSDLARTTHEFFATLADSNSYGQGLSG